MGDHSRWRFVVIYCRSGSQISWTDYLTVNAFVQDVKGTIRKSGREVRHAISEQTRQVVASNEALAATYAQGFDRVDGTLREGFGMMGRKLDAIGEGIEALGASFEYGMGMLAEQLEAQTPSVSVAPKWADDAWRRIASGRGCSEGRRGVCLQEGLERDSLEVPRTEVRGIGGNRKILGNGQSESMVRWHEQARLRRALSSMWNPGFGALAPAALGGAALGGKVTGLRPRRIGPGSGGQRANDAKRSPHIFQYFGENRRSP